METTKLSTKGQIILPKSVRDAEGLRPGAEFAVERTSDGILLRPIPQLPSTRLEDVIGCLHVPGRRAATIEDMDQAIAEEVRRRHARGRY